MNNLEYVQKNILDSIEYRNKLIKEININELVRCNILYFLIENKISLNSLLSLIKSNNKGDKNTFYKYLNGSRTIPLKFIELVSKSLLIDYKDLFDVNLYLNNISSKYDFSYKYKNSIVIAKNFNRKLDRDNYIFEQRNSKNKKTLRQLSLEMGLSHETIRVIANKQKQLRENTI